MPATPNCAQYDVIVAGGGMVGAMLAAALAVDGRLSVAVLEAAAVEPFARGSSPPNDLRVSALSVGSQRMLMEVGAWQGIVERRACPYREMLVWDGEAGGRTHFRAADIGAEVLGHIVENRVTQLALLDVLQAAETVDLICPARLKSFECHPQGVDVLLESGQLLQGKLLVGADGANSKVRQGADIESDRLSYEQHALVITVETESPQQAITWQRFMPGGPQALLPLCGHHASLVWYESPEDVARLKALDDAAFVDTLKGSFPAELGGIRRIVQRGSFPISRAHVRQYFQQSAVLVGDAAHTVHPLAGQGVNLGLLDAAALAEVLCDALDKGQALASVRTLSRYQRWRRGENELMIRTLDGFHHVFGVQPEWVQSLRSAVMNAGNSIAPAKNLAMRHAMGIGGNLPRIAAP